MSSSTATSTTLDRTITTASCATDSASTSTHSVHGYRWDIWVANGREGGPLRYPVAELEQLSDGWIQRFQKGCIVAAKDGTTAVPASPIQKLVDTTGAGDLFAAGFLFGLVRNAGYENAGRLGALAAAEVIQHIGARPQVSLKELAQKHGLPV